CVPASADVIGLQAVHVIEERATYQPRLFACSGEAAETCSLGHFAEHPDGDRLLTEEVPAVVRRFPDGAAEGGSDLPRPGSAQHIDRQRLVSDHRAALEEQAEVALRRPVV